MIAADHSLEIERAALSEHDYNGREVASVDAFGLPTVVFVCDLCFCEFRIRGRTLARVEAEAAEFRCFMCSKLKAGRTFATTGFLAPRTEECGTVATCEEISDGHNFMPQNWESRSDALERQRSTHWVTRAGRRTNSTAQLANPHEPPGAPVCGLLTTKRS